MGRFSTLIGELGRGKGALLVFLIVGAIQSTSPVSIQGDSRWTIPQALSIIHQGNVDLDEYAERFPAQNYYAIECVSAEHIRTYPVRQPICPGGHFYYRYPVSIAILAAPFVAAMQAGVYALRPVVGRFVHGHGVVPAFLNGDFILGSPLVEIVIASVFVAAAAAVLFLALGEITSEDEALAGALIFAFCTPAWSTASRALYQHAPSMLLNSALLLVLLRSFKNRKLLWWIGPIAAVDFFVRPTNIVPACVLGLYVSIRAPKQAIWAAAAASPIIALFVALSYDMYGTALAPYYSPQQANAPTLALHAHLAEALVGNWISPGRGLLVFCPFFLLLAVPSAWRTKLPDAFKTVGPWLISIVALHWILVSSYSDWVGGFSYGPRYMCDIVPFLIVLLTPAIHAIFQSGPGLRLDRVAFVVLVAAALFIHARGAYSMAPHDWNWQPVDINHAQRRVWDWSDPAFLRGL